MRTRNLHRSIHNQNFPVRIDWILPYILSAQKPVMLVTVKWSRYNIQSYARGDPASSNHTVAGQPLLPSWVPDQWYLLCSTSAHAYNYFDEYQSFWKYHTFWKYSSSWSCH
jgi:hypothetical protein